MSIIVLTHKAAKLMKLCDLEGYKRLHDLLRAIACVQLSVLKAVSACRTKWADCVREDLWLIVAPARSNDETSKQAHTGQCGEDSPGHP